nr:SMI1/KNR4 family protein [uncultured Oscillibacter sp.]
MLISKFDTAGIEEKLTALQARYGLVLPEEYHAFLRKYNGGETPETAFRLAGISSDLRGFFGLGTSVEAFALERRFDHDALSALVSKGLFPIGKNVFGDLLFIRTSGRKSGEILFQYHDQGKQSNKLANSFQDFTAQCISKPLKPCRSIEERIAVRRAAGMPDPPPAIVQEWQLEIDRRARIHQEELSL